MLKKEKTMKKSFVWFIFVLFSLLLLFGCGSLRKKAESEKVKKIGNIAGIVFDKITGEPLSGANVYVEGIATIGTKTDTLGRFWLSSIPVGEYSIQASQIGFHTGKVLNVKVGDNLTSIVTTGLVIGAIEPWGTSRDWGGKIIKSDSVSFFDTQYKDLVKNK